MIYFITSGDYGDYTVDMHIDGAANSEQAITDVINEHNRLLGEEQAKAAKLKAVYEKDFEKQNPKPEVSTPFNGSRFSEVYPEEDRILSVGKKHHDFLRAKAVNQKWIDDRDFAKMIWNEWYARQADYVKLMLSEHKFEQYDLNSMLAKAGFKVINATEIRM